MDRELTVFTAEQRLNLAKTIYNLSGGDFDLLLYALNPPDGEIPPSSARQADRAIALLKWVEGITGPGLNQLLICLNKLPYKQSNLEDLHLPILDRNDSKKAENSSIKIVLEADIEILEIQTLFKLIEAIGEVASSTKCTHISKGSVELTFEGNSKELEILKSLIESGKIKQIVGIPVKRIGSIVPKSSEIQVEMLLAKIDKLQQTLDQINGFIEQMTIHKDVVSNPDIDSNRSSSEQSLPSEVQIQRLAAQLAAAYNRIAALEEAILVSRVSQP